MASEMGIVRWMIAGILWLTATPAAAGFCEKIEGSLRAVSPRVVKVRVADGRDAMILTPAIHPSSRAQLSKAVGTNVSLCVDRRKYLLLKQVLKTGTEMI